MPCISDYGDEDRRREEAKTNRHIKQLEASLCAILSVLHSRDELEDVLEDIDEKEAGVTSDQIRSWWKDHKAEDAARRKSEAAAKEHDLKVKKAKASLRKMSEADLRALRDALKD